MAYDFIGLVNDINRRLNEVELTTAKFSTATGFYSLAKDAVNSAIQHINQEEFEWPWNHVHQEIDMVAGESRYQYPDDQKYINLNTFIIERDNDLGVDTRHLKVLAYEEWLDRFADTEYNDDASIRGVPEFIARTPGRDLVVAPSPDKAYMLRYEYFAHVDPLEDHDDVPTIPKEYRYTIVDGAMYYAYTFRGDAQNAGISLQKFEKGIKNLRSIYINRTPYIRDTRVHY